jgi:hypothetical protein
MLLILINSFTEINLTELVPDRTYHIIGIGKHLYLFYGKLIQR